MTIIGDVSTTLHALYGDYQILFQKQIDHCSLDPGGMVCIAAPYFEFQIEDNNFGIKSDQIESMLYRWKRATLTESLAEVPLWLQILVLPKAMYFEIQKKLEALHVSDVALHAELAREDILQKLENDGRFLRNPPQED